jgi:hypothetical protein
MDGRYCTVSEFEKTRTEHVEPQRAVGVDMREGRNHGTAVGVEGKSRSNAVEEVGERRNTTKGDGDEVKTRKTYI